MPPSIASETASPAPSAGPGSSFGLPGRNSAPGLRHPGARAGKIAALRRKAGSTAHAAASGSATAGQVSAALRRLGYSAAGLLALVILWKLGILWLQKSIPLAAQLEPGSTFQSLYELIVTNQLTTHTIVSLKRVLAGLALALLIGVPVGLAVGGSRLLENCTGSAFQFLRMISPLSWMPIAVMVFGIGDAPIYFLLTFAAVWPVLINTAAGVRQIDPKWLMLARSLSATRGEVLRRIIIPAILGHILTGARLAIGIIWIVLVPCEMLGVSSGLGYFILDTRDRMAYSELMAVIVLIGALGFLLDVLAQQLYRRWSRSPASR